MLDPLNPWYHIWLGGSLALARRYGDARAAYRDAKALAPKDVNVNGTANGWIGRANYSSDDFQSARAACESADEDDQLVCFALTYSELG